MRHKLSCWLPGNKTAATANYRVIKQALVCHREIAGKSVICYPEVDCTTEPSAPKGTFSGFRKKFVTLSVQS